MLFEQLNCVIVDGDSTNRQELATFLSERGAVVSAVLPSLAGLPDQLRRPERTQLVLVNLDPDVPEMMQMVAPIIREFHNINFFLMSQTIETSLLMEVIHIGAREFIPLPMRPERLIASLERIARSSAEEARGKVIQVIPTVGGCGATSVACNLGATLARSARTVLVDLDLVRGAVAANFNLSPRYTIADVMSSVPVLDRHLVENALVTCPHTNLSVLARPENPEDSSRVTRAGITRLLGVLARLFDYVVIDSVMSADALYLAVTRAAEINSLVLELNVPAVRNAERFISTMRRLGINTDTIKVIVNRFEKRGSNVKPDDVERSLGLPIAWMIPNDFKSAMAAINLGQPVVVRSPRAEMSGSISGLAQLFNGKTARR